MFDKLRFDRNILYYRSYFYLYFGDIKLINMLPHVFEIVEFFRDPH